MKNITCKECNVLITKTVDHRSELKEEQNKKDYMNIPYITVNGVRTYLTYQFYFEEQSTGIEELKHEKKKGSKRFGPSQVPQGDYHVGCYIKLITRL